MIGTFWWHSVRTSEPLNVLRTLMALTELVPVPSALSTLTAHSSPLIVEVNSEDTPSDT